VAAPRYDTNPAVRTGRQAPTTAGTHPTPTRPPKQPRSQQPTRADTDLRAATVLPHGYTLAQVEDAARVALHLCRTHVTTVDDAYDAARFAIIEHVYTATAPPERNQLIRLGRRAIVQYLNDEARHRGIPHRAEDRGITVARKPDDRSAASGISSERHVWETNCPVNFGRYWHWQTKPAPSSETRVVERTALAQIWPRLTEAEQRALSALAAADGDLNAAAAALGISPSGYRTRVSKARRRFLRLWHEHETPSRKWRVDIYNTDNIKRAARGRGARLVKMMLERPHRSDCRCSPCRGARLAATGRLSRRGRYRHAARARAAAQAQPAQAQPAGR
jgi:hypothetical protein